MQHRRTRALQPVFHHRMTIISAARIGYIVYADGRFILAAVALSIRVG